MAKKELLTASPDMKQEYCCTVVRIGQCFPIEGADRIHRTLVNGMDMVVSKDVTEGDLMIYAANECQLNHDFLSKNNLFGIEWFGENSNRDEVAKLIEEGKKDEAKRLCGFFHGEQCRVKNLRLKGITSFGFLFGLESLVNFCPSCKGLDLSEYIDKDFDTVDGTLFVKAYVPVIKESKKERPGGKESKWHPKENKKKIDQVIPGNFKLHYDSTQLQRSMFKLNPDTVIAVTVKVHGTSAVYANVLCNVPIKLPVHKSLWNKTCRALHLPPSWKVADTKVGYNQLYSSRTVIKNKKVEPGKHDITPTSDVWGYFNNILKGKIGEGLTIYGEIVGYLPGSTSFIQKNYDYGCPVGKCKFMPYRITDGKNEYDISQVRAWTEDILNCYPELEEFVSPIPLLFHGKVSELYPDIPNDSSWRDNVLAAMKQEKKFGMEQNETLCKTKVPREGVCVRIDGDPFPENFKLKCVKFLSKESAEIDAGKVDIEMQETDY